METHSDSSEISPRFVAEYIPSTVSDRGLSNLRTLYKIPDSVKLRPPRPDERACTFSPNEICIYESALSSGLRFPFPSLVRDILSYLNLAPGQLVPNSWRLLFGCMVLWPACSDGEFVLTKEKFLSQYQIYKSGSGWWYFSRREKNSPELISGLPSSNKKWKDRFFFVSGDGWEFALSETNAARLPRQWGDPSIKSKVKPVLLDAEMEQIRRVEKHPFNDYSTLVTKDNLTKYVYGPPKPTREVYQHSLLKKVDKAKLRDNVRNLATSNELYKRAKAGVDRMGKAQPPYKRSKITPALSKEKDTSTIEEATVPPAAAAHEKKQERKSTGEQVYPKSTAKGASSLGRMKFQNLVSEDAKKWLEKLHDINPLSFKNLNLGSPVVQTVMLESLATFLSQIAALKVYELSDNKLALHLAALRDFEGMGVDLSWLKQRLRDAEKVKVHDEATVLAESFKIPMANARAKIEKFETEIHKARDELRKLEEGFNQAESKRLSSLKQFPSSVCVDDAIVQELT